MTRARKAIVEMSGYAPGEQPTDPNIIKLNTNENPYPPAPEVKRALGKIPIEALLKYPDPTAEPLRSAAARLYRVKKDQILIGNGSDELLTIIVCTFADPKDCIAVASPTYSLYKTLAQIQDAKMEEIPFPEDYSLPKKLFNNRARIVFLPNPNAPSGTLVGRKDISRLAKSLKGLLVLDEAYVDFASDNCLPLLKQHPNLVILRTLSKSYSLASLRLGIAAASQEIIRQMMKVKDSYNINLATQLGGLAALEAQAHMKKNAERICKSRAKLTRDLEKLGFFVWPSQANFVLARVPDNKAKRYYLTLKKRGILVRFFDTPRLCNSLRITVGKPSENAQLIRILKSL